MVLLDKILGKTFSSVQQKGDAILFQGEKSYSLHHDQDCCEIVEIEDICGDLRSLENTPILNAYSETGGNLPPKKDTSALESYTWTFFRIFTAKGTVVIRFYGTSNGYYSEGADFYEMPAGENNG